MISVTSRRYRMEWLLLGMVLLIVGALIGYWLYAERLRMENVERDRLQVQARVIAENLARQLEGVGNALAGVRDDLPQWSGETMSVAPSRRLKVLSSVMPGVSALIVANAEGTVLDSNRDEFIGTNLRERDSFKAARAGADPARLYISEPHKTQLGVFSISLSLVLADPEGKFAGIVAAILDPEHFNTLLRSVLYAPDMRVVMVHWDGKAFVFVPPNERMVGVDLAKPGSFFNQHRESGQAATLLINRSILTGEDRMMASRTVDRAGLPMDKPLTIHVSRELSAVYFHWRKEAIAYGAFFGLIAVASMLGLHLLQRRRRAFDRLAAMNEKERSDSAERLELALAGADLGLWDWHVPSGKVSHSERWSSMLGYRTGEIESRISSWEQLVHPDDMPSARAMLDAHLKGETKAYESEHRMRHKDGGWLWILDRGKVVERDAAGAPVRVVGTHMDITERKRAEAARARLEAQARESQKMDALGTLAGGVAHDFNNILAAIAGNAELARQDVGPLHVALESLEEIRKASHRAKDLVQQILAFGRRQVLQRRVMSLAPIVEESVRLLRGTLPAGVSLSVECAPDTPAVLADATQIQQVLLNLCGNAWQAMQGQERPAAISVSLAPHQANDLPYHGSERRRAGTRIMLRPGRYACLTVRDTGPGMDRVTRLRIFEPFFTTKPMGKGTGLGLAVVYGIVQDHGASIAVQSAPGEGAVFRVYFPAVPALEVP